MNIVFYVIGAILLFASFLLMCLNWDDKRSALLANEENILYALLGGMASGITLMCIPMLMFSLITPVITFNPTDTILRDTIILETKEIYIEYNGRKQPVDEFTVKQTVSTPGCYVLIERKYDLLFGHDEFAKVLLSGTRCSEVKSFISAPQVSTVLSGWQVKLEQINIPTNLEF